MNRLKFISQCVFFIKKTLISNKNSFQTVENFLTYENQKILVMSIKSCKHMSRFPYKIRVYLIAS